MSRKNYVWSAHNNAFYPLACKADYLAAKTWPADGVAVADPVFHEYGLAVPPRGKCRGVDTSGMPVWVDDVAPSTPPARYAAATAAGLVVACASVPALDATYEVSQQRVRDISEQVQYAVLFGEFMNAQTSLDWPDCESSLHTFPDIPHFLAFAKAVMRYVFACRCTLDALLAGQEAAFPDNRASID